MSRSRQRHPNSFLTCKSRYSESAPVERHEKAVQEWMPGEAMQLHLDEIATKVPGRTPLYCLIRPAGMALKPWGFPTTSRSCRCRRAHPNTTVRKTSGSSCVRIGCQSDFQILRRYHRPLPLRLEHTHRPTMEEHVHRATRWGSSRSLNLRVGISKNTIAETVPSCALEGRRLGPANTQILLPFQHSRFLVRPPRLVGCPCALLSPGLVS